MLQTGQIKKDYKAIIGIVLVAIVLWFWVKMGRFYQYTVEVPIEYVNMPQGKIFKYPPVPKAEVEITGKGMELLRLPFSELIFEIDLADAPLHYRLNLAEHPELFKLPSASNISLKRVLSPRTLEITLDKRQLKKLPVKVNAEVEIPPGYLLAEVRPQPDSILIEGPAALFKNYQYAETETQSFSQKSRLFHQSFHIKPFEKFYALYKPEKTNVVFDIQRLAEREIPDVDVLVTNVPSDLQVVAIPSTAVVYVKGPEKVLAGLSEKDFLVEIDFIRAFPNGTKGVLAEVKSTANVHYLESRPGSFDLIVVKKNKKE
ncbi:MAG: hypothetical protein Kow0037_14260 [Calditrichia bacterium]